MQNGGCHPVDGCLDGDGFAGADFEFLAANVVRKSDRPADLPALRDQGPFDGVKVAFIGMTLENTPEIVTPSGVAGLEFRDEADTVNALVPRAQAPGRRDDRRRSLHEGGAQTGTFNECTGIAGAIVDIVNRTTTRSTRSSPATPTRPTTASSTGAS